jgi:hypothetical protein
MFSYDTFAWQDAQGLDWGLAPLAPAPHLRDTMPLMTSAPFSYYFFFGFPNPGSWQRRART